MQFFYLFNDFRKRQVVIKATYFQPKPHHLLYIDVSKFYNAFKDVLFFLGSALVVYFNRFIQFAQRSGLHLVGTAALPNAISQCYHVYRDAPEQEVQRFYYGRGAVGKAQVILGSPYFRQNTRYQYNYKRNQNHLH